MVRDANAAADAGQLKKGDVEPLQKALQKFDSIFAVMNDDDAVKVKQILEWAEREGKQDKITAEARAIAASASIGDVDIDRLVSEMQEARKAKNFSHADAIRGQLNEQGIIVEITKDGARWRRK